MKAAQLTTAATPAKKNTSFFNKESGQDFFHPMAVESSLNQISFFSKSHNNSGIQASPIVQTKCASCEQEDKTIQRQEQPDESVTKLDTPDRNHTPVMDLICRNCIEHVGELPAKLLRFALNIALNKR